LFVASRSAAEGARPANTGRSTNSACFRTESQRLGACAFAFTLVTSRTIPSTEGASVPAASASYSQLRLSDDRPEVRIRRRLGLQRLARRGDIGRIEAAAIGAGVQHQFGDHPVHRRIEQIVRLVAARRGFGLPIGFRRGLQGFPPGIVTSSKKRLSRRVLPTF
jgi:hypothetical protein